MAGTINACNGFTAVWLKLKGNKRLRSPDPGPLVVLSKPN